MTFRGLTLTHHTTDSKSIVRAIFLVGIEGELLANEDRFSANEARFFFLKAFPSF
jgi:hypothetical protein